MSDNPFADLQAAFASGWGISNLLAGLILGVALTFAIFMMLMLFFSAMKRGKGGSTEGELFVSMISGIGLSAVFGWFPIWLAAFIFAGMIFLIVDPFGMFGSGRHQSG